MVSDSMVERVARAICKSKTCEGVSCCQWPANLGHIQCPVKRGGYDDAARAAIAAMREPTAAMVRIADAMAPMYDDPLTTGEEYWQAMIDAALAEETK